MRTRASGAPTTATTTARLPWPSARPPVRRRRQRCGASPVRVGAGVGATPSPSHRCRPLGGHGRKAAPSKHARQSPLTHARAHTPDKRRGGGGGGAVAASLGPATARCAAARGRQPKGGRPPRGREDGVGAPERRGHRQRCASARAHAVAGGPREGAGPKHNAQPTRRRTAGHRGEDGARLERPDPKRVPTLCPVGGSASSGQVCVTVHRHDGKRGSGCCDWAGQWMQAFQNVCVKSPSSQPSCSAEPCVLHERHAKPCRVGRNHMGGHSTALRGPRLTEVELPTRSLCSRRLQTYGYFIRSRVPTYLIVTALKRLYSARESFSLAHATMTDPVSLMHVACLVYCSTAVQYP